MDDPKKLPDDHDPERVPGHPEPVDPNRPNPAGPPQEPAEEPDGA